MAGRKAYRPARCTPSQKDTPMSTHSRELAVIKAHSNYLDEIEIRDYTHFGFL
jgi:hypothetical protein